MIMSRVTAFTAPSTLQASDNEEEITIFFPSHPNDHPQPDTN
jgi:hypothetical protein